MTTVRQIERYWNAKDYGRLFRGLVLFRPEAKLRLDIEVRAALAALTRTVRGGQEPFAALQALATRAEGR